MEGQMRSNPERSHVYDQKAVTTMPHQSENLGRRAEKK